jgi:hypothetical protein
MKPKEETMKHDTKVHVRPESSEKQPGHKLPVQSQETAAPSLASLTQSGLQHLSPADFARLSRTYGNRVVERLLAQRGIPDPDVRQEEEEEVIPGPRNRQEEEEETIPGPRNRRQEVPEEEEVQTTTQVKRLREDSTQRRGSDERMSSPGQRGSRVAGLAATIGDASNLDGQGCYGWDRPMSASDVEDVVNDLLTSQSIFTENQKIVIFSGHHGTETGNLVGPVPEFYAEDQATAANAMSTYPGSQVEVIDDPSAYPTKAAMSPAFNTTSVIRILAWCFSKRSYGKQATLKANWWPEPDHIDA